MGEAKRRRAREAAKADANWAAGERWRAEWDEMERIAMEDPDDRAIREAHGLTWDDAWQDPEVRCRNGCGLPYSDIVGGKIRACRAARTEVPA